MGRREDRRGMADLSTSALVGGLPFRASRRNTLPTLFVATAVTSLSLDGPTTAYCIKGPLRATILSTVRGH